MKCINLKVLDSVQQVSKLVQVKVCNKFSFFFLFTCFPCPCLLKAAKEGEMASFEFKPVNPAANQ